MLLLEMSNDLVGGAIKGSTQRGQRDHGRETLCGSTCSTLGKDGIYNLHVSKAAAMESKEFPGSL
jgi:hypothetical protein